MPKTKLRRVMLDRRKALSTDEYKGKSILIQQRLISLEEYAAAKVVALYSSIHNEVEMDMVMTHALSSGKKVVLPTMSDGVLLLRELTGVSNMRQGTFGILEPCESGKIVDPCQADIIVLPGIAFDLSGHRVGYGKGCYDKALHRLEGEGKLVAVCYDFQLVDEIMGEPHDVRVDVIVTEQRVVYVCQSEKTLQSFASKTMLSDSESPEGH
ncbi:MAG TPA: 5-formyltetrahydrofolate cyclo-ligase [Geobacteraceae bacterium]|nr:5-formyltetrahydrofolate cyclo-ligase [Geobacteraceae bacterium]